MARGIVKFPENTRLEIRERLKEAENDPLFYLNLCGVTALNVCDFLDLTEARRVKIKRMAQDVTNFNQKIQKRVARLQQKQKNSFGSVDVRAKLKAIDSEIATFYETVAKRIDLPPKQNPKAKRRAPLNHEFKLAVNQLVAECQAEMTSEAKDPAHWSLLSAITCLMIAAWPDWFRSDSPAKCLRKVKACWPKRKASRRRPFLTVLVGDYPTPLEIQVTLDFIRNCIEYEPSIR